ncbi:hypothetical protein JCM3774_004850 [Rhodotorula dairenensis]
MRLIQAVAILATALLVSAQSDTADTSNPTAGLLSDFPTQCSSTCAAFNDSVQECGQLAESQSEQAGIDCLCNGSFKSQIETCGGCIAQNTADVSKSQSFAVIAQLGMTFGQQCGTPVNFQGVSPEISSALADTAGQDEATMTDTETFDGATNTAAGATGDAAATSVSAAVATLEAGPSRSSSDRQAVSTSGTAALPSNTAQNASTPKETSGAGPVASPRTVLLPLLLAAILPFALW